MLEMEIEQRVKEYARERGWLAYKWVSPSHIGVPDGILISPNGKVIFVEFKATGKMVTPMQERELLRLQQQCCTVSVIDNVEAGKAMIDTWRVE
jgi:hypothetical protein